MMLVLALLLATLGVADAMRHVAVTPSGKLAAAWTGGLVMVGLGTWGMALAQDAWWIVPVLLLATTAWVVLPELGVRHARSSTLVAVAIVAVAIVAFSRVVPGRGFVHRWYDSLDVPALDGVGFERFVLGVAVVVFLHSSANVIVRLVLAGSGPHVLESEQSLKGGRILGPIERWLIFGFALSGQLGAIAAVVAAKGIVRFPEISRSDNSGTKAEYFLVGSFVSWFLALLFVPLLK